MTYGYLAHHGIKGQKWGVRRFQNPDGTLTEEGRRRYGKSVERGRNLIKSGETVGSVVGKGIKEQAIYQLGKVGFNSAMSIASGVTYSAVVSGVMSATTYTMAVGAMATMNVLGSAIFLTATAINAIDTVRNARDVSNANKVKG